MNRNVRLVVYEQRKNPRLTRIPPASEHGSGPNLSCILPATTKLRANTITAIVNTIDVSARFHPNRASSGATKTLHAYSVPRARFIDNPPTTRHQRPIVLCSFDCILDIVG